MKPLLTLRDFPIIIADESVDSRIVKGLVSTGFSVFSVGSETPGISDSAVIKIAIERKGFILTEDKDFGDELVYRKVSTVGSMLLRLLDLPIDSRIRLVIETITHNSRGLENCFSVLTSKKLRIRKYM